MKDLIILIITFLISLFATIKAQECVVLTVPGFPQTPEQTYGDPNILSNFSLQSSERYLLLLT